MWILQQLIGSKILARETAMGRRKVAQVEILAGWKAIANHLGRGVRTVQRYERELGLPIRRPSGKSHGSVIATKAELDGWVSASPIRESFPLPQRDLNTAVLLTEFKTHVAESRTLRQATEGLRHGVRAGLELLRKNLRIALPEGPEPHVGPPLTDSERRVPADVLIFDPMKKKAN